MKAKRRIIVDPRDRISVPDDLGSPGLVVWMVIAVAFSAGIIIGMVL